MDIQLKRRIIEDRIERLKAHLEFVGPSEGFERELARAEDELREVEKQNEQPSS